MSLVDTVQEVLHYFLPSLDIPRDAPSQAPQAGITYLWIFEGASKEEVGF